MHEPHACESMVPLILRYADGTLGGADRARLEAHAAACEGCRDAMAAQHGVSTLLSEVGMADVTPGFAARVRARVEPAGGLLDVVNWRAWSLRLAPVAGLLAVLAWLPGLTQGTAPADTSSAPAQIEAWAAGDTNSTTALLVNSETDPVDLLAAVYAGEPQ